MNELEEPNKKPLVGFFPRFYGMGETYPLVEIAKYYKKLGGKVVFFSHGGEYEYLVKEQGFEIVKVNPIARDTSKYLIQHTDEEVIKIIKEEAKCYEDIGIKALVQTNVFFGCLLASRIAKVPLISVVSGEAVLPHCKAKFATYPDINENYFTILIPQYIKNQFIKLIYSGYKGPVTKKINRLAKKLDIDIRFKCKIDLLFGDHTLVCDDIEFLDAKPTKEVPLENYIGPILASEWHDMQETQLDFDIENHLKKPGRHILLTMGSSLKWKILFLELLKILNKTEYNVIATYTTILNENEIPNLNKNILLKKFIKNIIFLNSRVDLAVVAGGRGTVYAAAYSGKPAIGIPLHSEQQNNLDNLVRHGCAIRLSKKFFKEKDMLNAIEKIFNNYNFYLNNAQALSKSLPAPEGDKNAARRIIEILQKVTDNHA